jgi:DNA-binding CsgD family transcriptional regulator
MAGRIPGEVTWQERRAGVPATTENGELILDYHSPLNLTPRHKTIIALSATGLNRKEVAQIIGCAPATITNVLKHPDAERLLAQLTSDHVVGITEDVSQGISATAKEAFLTIRGLMREAKSEVVRQNCAFDIMDRAGFKAREIPQQPPVNLGDGKEFLVALRESRGPVNEKPQIGSTDGIWDSRTVESDNT